MVPNTSVVGSVANSTFNPKWLSGLQMWYDAADSSTIFNNPTGSSLATNGQSVGRWEDKSGNNYHAYQFTGSRQPTYVTASLNQNLSSLTFLNTATCSFEVTSSAYGILKNKGGISVFGVMYSVAPTTGYTILGISTNTATSPRYELTNFGTAFTFIITRTIRIDGTAIVTSPDRSITMPFSGSAQVSPLLITSVLNYNEGTSSRLYADGVLAVAPINNYTASYASYSGSTSNTDSARILIGSRVSFTNLISGSMFEIICYDRVLNNAERRAVERYLGRKWNVRSYDQKTSASTDIFSNVDVYVDANNTTSNPGSGTTWFDLSGNNRSGSLENGASFATSGGIKYVDCDGSDDNVNFGKILNYTSESFSTSMWIYPKGTTGRLFYFKGAFQADGYYCTGTEGTATGPGINFNRSGISANAGYSLANSGVPNETWAFITFTRAGNQIQGYINGARAMQFNLITFDPQSSANDFRLALWPGFSAGNIRIGMFMAQRKQLNSQEVRELYELTKGTYGRID